MVTDVSRRAVAAAAAASRIAVTAYRERKMADPIALDISHWQPDPIDWTKVKAAGVVGVIHKATEGTRITDKKLFSRAKAAMDAGLKWSTYHFLRQGSMSEQMDYYIGTINPVEGERVCLDHEDARVSLDDLIACVKAVRTNRPDLQIAIYSGHLIKDQLAGNYNKVLAENTSLWLAQYTTVPTWPMKTWPQWSLWQYTDKANVAGISGDVDGNRFNGSAENCAAWFGPAGQPPVEEPGVVRIETSGKVTLIVNGVTVQG